jgi:hypothetical protein
MLALFFFSLIPLHLAVQAAGAATPPRPGGNEAIPIVPVPSSPVENSSATDLPAVRNTTSTPATDRENPAPAVAANPEKAPVLERVFPLSGKPGDLITLEGRRFGTHPKVIFKEVEARIVRSSDTSITAVVPASTTFPIIVETEEGTADTAEPFIYSLKTENGVLFPVPLGDGRWFPHHPFWDAKPIDPVARFLQYYWDQPLQPQGKAPDFYGPIEADLRPESCATCHPAQYKDWKGALHSTTASPLLRWTLRDKKPSEANACRRCHDPLAEPGDWLKEELFRKPEDLQHVPLRRDGVQCAACHVRQHTRYGPPALPRDGPAPPPAHGGFRPEQAFEDSRFCAGCHTFAPRVHPGGLVGDPFEEWRTSRFAAEGVSCQKCHMPERRHLFRGIHDRDMTLSGLTIGLEVRRDEKGQVTAAATITSTNVGHMFPTYPVPRIHVQLFAAEQPLGETYVIGRDIDLIKGIEHWDRRLAPGQSYVMRRAVPAGQQQVTLRIDVVPRDRYEKDLGTQLAFAEKVPGHVFLEKVRELLEHEKNYRYRLVDLTVRPPVQPGVAQRVIKEGREISVPDSP